MSEDERLIRNDPAIREIAQMVTNYCASCVELEARATAAEAENARLAALVKEALIKQENDRTMWVPEWQIWAVDARAALESRNVG